MPICAAGKNQTSKHLQLCPFLFAFSSACFRSHKHPPAEMDSRNKTGKNTARVFWKATVHDEKNWWKNTVIYQIYPRSFQDSNGDGIGDLKGITARLRYLKELGVETIWISPFYKSPMDDFGYDVSDFTAVDPLFGAMHDFDGLVTQVHEYDMKIVLDFVPNHTSSQHPWFLASQECDDGAYSDYYVWHAGNTSKMMNLDGNKVPSPPTNWLSVFGGSAWAWNEKRQKYYLHQFLPSQPDLNFRCRAVVHEMDQVLLFWLRKGVDGFRIDAIKHLFEVELPEEGIAAELVDENLPHPKYAKHSSPAEYGYWNHDKTCNQPETFEIIRHWREVLDSYSASTGTCHKMIVTEVTGDVDEFLPYYDCGADFSFNFHLLGIGPATDGLEIDRLVRAFLTHCSETVWPNWLTGNHDGQRVADRTRRSEFVDAVNMLNLLLPGTANVYYGEELGMSGARVEFLQDVQDTFAKRDAVFWKSKNRDPGRSPMQWSAEPYAGFSSHQPWLPVAANFRTCNVQTQLAESFSHLNIFKQLLALRKLPAFAQGSFHPDLVTKTVYSFFRRYNSDIFLIILDVRLFGQEVIAYDFSSIDLQSEAEVIVISENLSTRSSSLAHVGGRVLLDKIALLPSEACVLRVYSRH